MAEENFPNQSILRPKELWISLFLLSVATLVFEINLSRLFSVQQFYHFAFMIVSIALLGFGASGTLLAIFPETGKANPNKALAYLSLATSISMIGAYLLINWLPFDSFSIAWERRQILILVLHYVSLSLPFFFSGMAVGILLSRFTSAVGTTYAVNLLGSALGCLTALYAPSLLGGEGTVILSSGLAASAAITTTFFGTQKEIKQLYNSRIVFGLAAILLICFSLLDMGIRLSSGESFIWLKLNISPYKSLSYALQFPDAKIISQKWNAFSRVDLLRSEGNRTLPGLSYRYLKPLPSEDGLLVNGDELTPVILPGYSPEIFEYTPTGVIYALRPKAKILIIEPRGGLEIFIAINLGAERILAVESNPLNIEAAQHIYNHPKVKYVEDSGRSFLRQEQEAFDIVVMPLTDSFHPVRSGAYSLSEDYRYTLESFKDALSNLKPDSLMVVTRWLQTPPSESLRTFALAVTALESQGYDAEEQIVVFRSFNTSTVILKNIAFTSTELDLIRNFCRTRAYDLVFTPDISPYEVNQFNIMPEPVYYQTFTQLLNSNPRQDFYDNYSYNVEPPTDQHPFFSHYFKWSQSSQVLAEFGKTWQPFGGAGYFVIFALFILAISLSIFLILLPAGMNYLRQKKHGQPIEQNLSQCSHTALPVYIILLYFGLIGFAFLLVEIPLIQKFILFLGHPAYAMTSVLFSILFFSGIGSIISQRIRLVPGLAGLVLLLTANPLLLHITFQAGLGAPFNWRLLLTLLVLAPVGLLMGIPFPGGLYWASSQQINTNLIPQIWAVNGASSVIASILAALLSLSFGFNWVLYSGALCYLGACFIILFANTFLKRASLDLKTDLAQVSSERG